MNNQITLLDRNSQPMNVDLICYFVSGNKKYVFYTNNETVQDGLIKMYVAEENTGLSTDITPDEWNGLKKIMQGIITGNMGDIQFLAYNGPLKFNEGKAIALNDTNIDALKKAYKNSVGTTSSSGSLNKDLLTQNFGGNIEPPQVSTPEPVQISSIPQSQNSFNMESTPVNLNTSPVVEEPTISPFNSVPNIEPIVQSSPSIDLNLTSSTNDNNSNTNTTETPLNINNIKPSGIESGFKVSNEPNIFDQPMSTSPFQITEEEINKPIVDSKINVSDNLFNKPIESEISNSSSTVSTLSNDKKILLNERKIKLFEELANVYREENEMLKNEDSANELEHTASNLFNSNGTLNENEVLS